MQRGVSPPQIEGPQGRALARTCSINYYSHHGGPVSTTIQLEEERKARLARLKVGGMTYDDVVARLLAEVDEEAFRRRAIEWQEDLARRIRSNKANRPVL